MRTWIEFLSLIGETVHVAYPGVDAPVAAQVTGVERSGDLYLRLIGGDGMPRSAAGFARGVIFTGPLDQETGMPHEYLQGKDPIGGFVLTCWAPAVEETKIGQELIADSINLDPDVVKAWNDEQSAVEAASSSADFEIEIKPLEVEPSTSDPALAAAYGGGASHKTVGQLMKDLPGLTEEEAQDMIEETDEPTTIDEEE